MEHNTREAIRVKGYPSLATFIASDAGKSASIYRRFDRLYARNLLCLQSKLAELEVRQDAFDAENLNVSVIDEKCARNWEAFSR
jgi:hypothetical protein